MLRKIMVIALTFIFSAGAVAFAQDGFKVFVGYDGGRQFMKTSVYLANGTGISNTKNVGGVHGPSVEVQYSKSSVFLRAMSSYHYVVDSTSKYSGGGDDKMKGYTWDVEGDLGYKVYDKQNVSLTPYLGYGYYSARLINKESKAWGRYSTPYAAFGNIVAYTAERWSVGLDTAFLMPFGGKFKEPFATFTYASHTKYGYGARVQLPMTYTILSKKDNGAGVMLFVTPSYEYLNSRKSEAEPVLGVPFKTKEAESNFVVKVGIGFKF